MKKYCKWSQQNKNDNTNIIKVYVFLEGTKIWKKSSSFIWRYLVHRVSHSESKVQKNFYILFRNSVPKNCSCPFVRYFRMLFWDDITIICWWILSKQTSYWSKIVFFSVKKVNNIFIPNYHSKILYKNIIQKDVNKFLVSIELLSF